MSATNIKAIFRPLKRLASKLLRHDRIHARIDDLADRQNHLVTRQSTVDEWLGRMGYSPTSNATFPIPPWYDQNLCEPTVQIVLRDLCRPGDTVFDVGANAGALSVLMSRLVGLRGAVCSFEASRRIVDKTQHNIIVNGCNNIQLYHRAIYHTSGKTVVIYHGSHLNDSILSSNDAGVGKSEVETLSLDDFVAWTGIEPKLIKMDIEGAEFDALRGAEKLIARAHPALILEQQPDDMRCIDLLRSSGYVAIDLATYRVVQSRADFPTGVEIANVLCLHASRIAATPYQPPFRQSIVAELPGVAFRTARKGAARSKRLSGLKNSGRYMLDFDFAAAGKDNEVMLGVDHGSKTLVRYHAYSHLLAQNYRQIPIDLKKGADLTVFFRFLNGTKDPSLQFRKVTVSRIVRTLTASRGRSWTERRPGS